MLKNYLRKTHMRRGVLTESSSAAPHNFQARKMYFDVLLDNLKNSDIPALKKFYDIEPIFDSKQKYSMTIESIDSRYPNLEFNYAVYEPISVFVGTECSYTTIKRTAEYQMPSDFYEVFSIKKRVLINDKLNTQKLEKLFSNIPYVNDPLSW